jgi:signal transduction histidine kinase/CheY-like chemotaxis protein
VQWQIPALLFSSAFEFAMLLLVRERLRTHTAGPFCLALALNAVWALGYAIELMTPTLAGKELVFQIRCTFLCAYALAWVETVHRMTRGRPLLTGWTLGAFLIVPVVSVFLLWFPGPGQNPFLRHSFWIDSSGGLPVLRNGLGPWGVVYYLYNYAVWACVFFLLYPFRKQTAWERRGRFLILAAALIGWSIDLLHLFNLTSPPGLNYAPVVFPVTSTLVAAALLRHRLLDLAPVARSALIERLEDRILVLDEQDRVIDQNSSAAGTFGFKSRPAVGRPASELFKPWPDLLALIAARDNRRGEFTLHPHVFEVSLFSVIGGEECRAGARVLILRDITARKNTELQLRRAIEVAEAAGESQSRFLATMSHEIRTPMNGVIGFTRMLKETPLTPRQNDYLELIDQSSRALLVIINDVLDYSKITADKLEVEKVRCDIRVLCEQTVRLLGPVAGDKGVGLELHVSPGVPETVIGDPVRISQILANLVGNAIKFTEKGGVTLDVGAPGPDLLVFRVTDTGIGIAPEHQARVLTPFGQADASTTRRFGGTGLGLSITRRLCELMDGCLTFSSEPGKGSVFTAAIRAASAAAPRVRETASPAPAAPAAPAGADSLNLLVCEDNSVNQAVIRAFLARLGHAATLAENGREGIELLARERFDAVLMDMEMPVMDGYEAVRLIRAAETPGGPRIRIIALTAHALKGERERCLALGMDDYLTKPVTIPDLKSALDRVKPRSA